jgi:CHAD domain-containing protein
VKKASRERKRELKLIAPAGFRLPDLGGVNGVTAASAGRRQLLATYLDSDDFRLARAGVTLRHRTDEGWTLTLPEPVADTFSVPGTARNPPAELVDLVAAFARGAPLEPRVRLRTSRRAVELTGDDGAAVAVLLDDTVSSLDGDRRVLSTFRELEVDPADGAPAKLSRRVIRFVEAAGATVGDGVPQAVRAAGVAAQAPADVVVSDLATDASAGDVVRRALASSVARLIANDPVVRLDSDPEGVHKARVATRTLRSDLRTFAPLVDAAWSYSLRRELGRLAALLGHVRDADVMTLRMSDRVAMLAPAAARAAGQIVTGLEAEREDALAELLAEFRGDRYTTLLDRLVEAAQAPVLTPAAEQPAAEVVPELVRGPWLALQRAVEGLDAAPSDEDLHAVRIKAKRCRYAAEAGAPYLGKRADEFARAAADLQTALGDVNDAVVAEAWLRRWARGRRSAAVFAAGELAGLERAAAVKPRAAWPSAWKALVAVRPRSLA